MQPKAGRLDLLLQDKESKRRYEVEVQLGATDETHIIRTLEYWDIERKRYPQYEHTAVLVAEEVTGRFLNVISLFNVSVPLMAIKMQAIRVGGQLSLVFTTVLDLTKRGMEDEEEDALVVTDRAYWVQSSDQSSLEIADAILGIVHEFDATCALKYNKFYIGISKDGRAFNFIELVPKKKWCELRVKLPYSAEQEKTLVDKGLDLMSYDTSWNYLRVRVSKADLAERRETLADLIQEAFLRRIG